MSDDAFISPQLRQLMRERKLLENAELMARELARIQEIKAAYFEGWHSGAIMVGVHFVDECWLHSIARGELYAGPPTPMAISLENAIRGYPRCDCRRPGSR